MKNSETVVSYMSVTHGAADRWSLDKKGEKKARSYGRKKQKELFILDVLTFSEDDCNIYVMTQPLYLKIISHTISNKQPLDSKCCSLKV